MMTKIEELLNTIMKKAEVDLTKGELRPIFFVGNDEKMTIVSAEWETDAHKNAVAALVRKQVDYMDATYVLFLSESWSLEGDAAKDFYENRSKYSQVADHPERIEVVTIFIEHLVPSAIHWAVNSRMGMAKILEGRKMGPITWTQEGTRLEGRFSGFILPKKMK